MQCWPRLCQPKTALGSQVQNVLWSFQADEYNAYLNTMQLEVMTVVGFETTRT